MSNEVKFVPGVFAKPPHPNAPDFVKCAISIKVADLLAYLQQAQGEWINLDVKESQGGKWYAAINEFKPTREAPSGGESPDPSDEIPF